MKMLFSGWVYFVLTVGVVFAAEPETLAEARKAISNAAAEHSTYTADFVLERATSITEGGLPETSGYLAVDGKAIRMTLSVFGIEDRPELDIRYDAVMTEERLMRVAVRTPTGPPPRSKFDTTALNKLLAEHKVPFGVPASGLDTPNLAAGLMLNPSTVLDELEPYFNIKFEGRVEEGADVTYAFSTMMKPEVEKACKKNEVLSQMFDRRHRIRVGATDGVVRQIISGETTMKFSNIVFLDSHKEGALDFDSPVNEDVDMTEQMVENFRSMVED